MELSSAFSKNIKNIAKADKKCRKVTVDKHLFLRYNIRCYGGAMVSTGILNYDKRGEPGKLVNCPTEKINDNNTVAMAA